MIKKRKTLPALPAATSELQSRILRHVHVSENGCWCWTGCLSLHGYGKVTIRSLGYHGAKAHRVSYEAFVGPIPEGHGVLHRCDNTKCVNPSHLFTGTQFDNMQDAALKDRTSKGSSNHFAKLSESDIVAIILDNRLQREIAAYYGVTQSTISYVKSGHVWGHAI